MPAQRYRTGVAHSLDWLHVFARALVSNQTPSHSSGGVIPDVGRPLRPGMRGQLGARHKATRAFCTSPPIVHTFASGSPIMRLLNIVSSPRGAKSVSISVANAFLDAYGKASASIEVDTLNVWDENLP